MSDSVTEGNNTNTEPMPLVTVQATVKSKISECNPIVIDAVVQHFLNNEITRRVDLMVKLMECRDKLDSALKRVKPDVVTYDGKGGIASSGYSKAADERVKTIAELLYKVTFSLNDMISKSDYSKAAELIEKANKALTTKSEKDGKDSPEG